MIKSDIKKLHIELTNRCNAGCPFCGRTSSRPSGVTEFIENSGWIDLQLETLKKIPWETMKRVNFCGNYGDPAIHPKLIDIVEYVEQFECKVHVVTNGSLRNTEWWTKLAKTMTRRKSHVRFSIDGLRDTNHLYRRNTNFDTIIKNAQTFIDNGGRAEWVFIAFQHNEHQIEEARELAKKIGFKKFILRRNNRTILLDGEIKEPRIPPVKKVQQQMLDKFGGTPSYVPQKNELKKWTESTYERRLPPFDGNTSECGIKCKSQETDELFISCDGDVLPCCWWGNNQFATKYDPNHVGHKDKHVQILKNMKIDLRKYDWDEIINEYKKQRDYIELLWSNDPEKDLPKCYSQCGTQKNMDERRKETL